VVARRACLVWRCRRGTQRLSRSAELNPFPQYTVRQFGPWCGYRAIPMLSLECDGNAPVPRSRQTLNPAHAGFSFKLRHIPISTRPCEYRGALATLPGSGSLSTCANPPHLSAAQSKERAPARDYATASALAGRPRATSPKRRSRKAEAAEGPQLRHALAMLDAQASALQAKWGHGVGRHARQMRGEIVRTQKNLRVRSRSLRVQTGLYRSLYPWQRPSFS